jgi:uncharacterized protein YbaP (TraB family)
MRLLFVLCLLAAAATGAAAEPQPLKGTPAMWVAHGARGTAYMLGSVHALPKNIDWETPQILAAVARSDTFVFEVPMDEETRAAAADTFRQNALLPSSMALPSFFDEQMRAQYRDVITLTRANPAPIVYLRPWLAALVLQGVASGGTGFIASEGVDNKIYALAAKKKHVKFRALETDELQFRLLMGNGKMEDELALLRATFAEILKKHATKSDALLAAWTKGDVKALAAIGPDSKGWTPQAKKALLDDRNRAWLPQIEAMLKEPHTYFITVGAAHLVGQGGVPQLLRRDGIQVDGP